MRDILESVASGELSVEEAMAELAGYATTEAGRFDAARESRTGIPEGILADGKTPDEVATLAATAVETTGSALVTRATPETAENVTEHLTTEYPDASIVYDERARAVIAHGRTYEPPNLSASIGVATAGTSDAEAAGEAAVVASEMGATVNRISDIGVASLTRLVDQLDTLRDQDVLVIAAGREGALPTVTAGLVDIPVIGLPVSVGYGHAGNGEAALSGMLQSCTPLAVVNIDAGFTAGAQAGLIAQALDDER